MSDHDYAKETYEEEMDTYRRERIRAMSLCEKLELITDADLSGEPRVMKYIDGEFFQIKPKAKITILVEAEIKNFVPGLERILEEIIIDNNFDKQ